MRTKILIVVAAISAAGLATSLAQSNVYSQNVVGYINVQLTNGFNLVGNQLDLDGNGTNNTVQSVFGTNLPVNTDVYAFSGGGFVLASYGTKGWSGAANVNPALQPGRGVFIKLPSASTVTLVGNVMQGGLQTPYVKGFNIIGSQVPQAGTLQTDLGYAPNVGDDVYRYNPATKGYVLSSYGAKGWSGGQPNLNVGESVWLKGATNGTWTRNFTVQ